MVSYSELRKKLERFKNIENCCGNLADTHCTAVVANVSVAMS